MRACEKFALVPTCVMNFAEGTRYTLYALDERGRVWLATHEWTGGQSTISGGEWRTA